MFRWRSQTLFVGLSIAALSASIASSQSTPVACSTQIVTSSTGPVCGFVRGGAQIFLGIPYAESTGGANRWMPPVKKAAWKSTLKATRFGFACPQNGSQPLPQSEDCLSLNIWKPVPAKGASGARLPVLVFIHGGAFQTGSSGDTLPSDPKQVLYDGAYLASSQRVVVVTMNYRLGALGFLAGAMGLKGNYGFQDQQLALEWVRDNIAAFGGDSRKVTLSGESAGAMSVGLHMLSAPRSQNLFNAAIMQSNPLGLPYRTLSQARRTGEYFTLTAGCYYALQPMQCMRALPVAKLLKAQSDPMLMLPLLEFGLSSMISWSPVIDGEVITTAPVSAMNAKGGYTKPVLAGVNAHEGELFVAMGTKDPVSDLMYRAAVGKLFQAQYVSEMMSLYPSLGADSREQLARISTEYFFLCANRFAALKAKSTVYTYRYDYASTALSLWPALPACKGKACHSDELPFTFGNLGASKGITRDDVAMSKRLTEYWGAFVRTGQPSASSAPQWPRYVTKVEMMLEFTAAPRTKLFDAKTCAFWDRYGYDRSGDFQTQ
jgi:carboxylesterase type B